MDYSLVSYDLVSGLCAVIAIYGAGGSNPQQVCATTYFYISPAGLSQSDPSWNAQVEEVIANVLECVPTQAANPNYDPSLSACWP